MSLSTCLNAGSEVFTSAPGSWAPAPVLPYLARTGLLLWIGQLGPREGSELERGAWEFQVLSPSFPISARSGDPPQLPWIIPIAFGDRHHRDWELWGSVAPVTSCLVSLHWICQGSGNRQAWLGQAWRKASEQEWGTAEAWLYCISVMPTLSVFMDVPLAQKLEGSLLKTYKQDDCPNKIFLAFRGRCFVVGESYKTVLIS